MYDGAKLPLAVICEDDVVSWALLGFRCLYQVLCVVHHVWTCMTSIGGCADVGYISEFSVVGDKWLSWCVLVIWSFMGLLFLLPFLQLWVVPWWIMPCDVAHLWQYCLRQSGVDGPWSSACATTYLLVHAAFSFCKTYWEDKWVLIEPSSSRSSAASNACGCLSLKC